MLSSTLYILISVVVVSLVSLVGIFALVFKKKLDKILMILISLSAGTLFGGAFLHLLPEAAQNSGFTLQISLLVLAGIVVFFILEKVVHMHHHHHHITSGKEKHPLIHDNKKHIGILNLVGDGMHNFLDGLVIAGSYLVSIPVGIATTIAVVLHEVPQELADFGVLLYSGFSKRKALLFNFLSATISILGAIIGIFLGLKSGVFIELILPFAAGGFIYIAGSNLIPELHKHCKFRESLKHLAAMVVGIGIMVMLLFLV